jgi:thiol-disulfide isomerase/thioredoxin
VSRQPRPSSAIAGARMRARRLAGPALITVAALTLAGCDGGDIGANTPLSSGASFVGSNYQSTYFTPGSRSKAPAVAGTTVAGGRLSLADDRGDVIALNFWGSWCAPCRSEAPALGTLATQLQPKGIRFVGIDIRDEPTAALAFMQNFRISYPSISDPSDFIAAQFHDFPPAAIPSTIIIDRTGRVAAVIIGPVNYRNLKVLLTKVAAEHS